MFLVHGVPMEVVSLEVKQIFIFLMSTILLDNSSHVCYLCSTIKTRICLYKAYIFLCNPAQLPQNWFPRIKGAHGAGLQPETEQA